MRYRWMHRGLLALASVLGACSLNVNVDGAQFKCDADNPCPVGKTCGSDGTCSMSQVTGCAAQLTSGVDHACAIRSDGTAWCWGRNTVGQLGDGSHADQVTPVRIAGSGLPKFTAIAGGAAHTCAVGDDHTVWCWGHNDSGQLGNNTFSDSNVPISVIGLSTGAKAIAAGDEHTCALLIDNTLACWGLNDAGQLGNPVDTSPRPVPVTSLTGVTDIAAYAGTTCAVTPTAMMCWGQNGDGQLGDGTIMSRATPMPAMISDVSHVAVGRRFACGLTNAGAVFCAGNNDGAQLGDAVGSSAMPIPAALAVKATAIRAGDDFACVVDDQHRVWCWGDNRDAQLDASTQPQAIPLLTAYGDAAGLAAGSNFVCVQSTANGITCSGYNGFGELGNGKRTTQSTPQQVAGLSSASIASGGDFTCAADKAGNVQCWGGNEFGQLGDGTFQPHARPAAVLGVTGALQVVAGNAHACALINPGANVMCWGVNNRGQLADGTNVSRSLARTIKGVTGVSQLAASGDHTCAVTGTQVKCWGSNDFGSNGNNDPTDPFNGDLPRNKDSFTPVTVQGLAMPAKGVAVGDQHACAILASGGAVCWGADGRGQLGDSGANSGKNPPASIAPVAVQGISNVTQISAHGDISCARTMAGTVACWGYGGTGVLGQGNFDDASTAKVITAENGALDVVTGDFHVCARSSTNALTCWGANDFGQLGDGTFNVHPVPPPAISGLTDVRQYSVSGLSTCSVSGDAGTVSCWGDDRSGQLGDGVAASSTPVTVQLACP